MDMINFEKFRELEDGYNDYNIMLLFNIIIHSIFMTIIYTSISYFIIKFMYNKFGIKYIK